MTNRSGRPATRSTRSGRSTRSCLSTSITRRPSRWYSLSSAFTSELLPVPRAPVRRTLFAGRPATNWRVLRSTRLFCRSTPHRSESRIRCGCATGTMRPRPSRLRQRNAIAAVQSTGGAGGGTQASSRSTRPSSRSSRRPRPSPEARSRPVFRVDLDVVIREVAGPYSRLGRPAPELDPHADLGWAHNAGAVFFAVVRRAAAAVDDLHVAEPETDAGDVQVRNAGIADRHEQASEVGVGGEERRLDERRMGDRLGDA